MAPHRVPSLSIHSGSGVPPPPGHHADHRNGAGRAQTCLRPAESRSLPTASTEPTQKGSASEGLGERLVVLGTGTQPDTLLSPRTLLTRTREHWDAQRNPYTNIGTIRSYLLVQVGTCIHLGPGNPNVHKEVGNPKVFNQVEGIGMSHVGWLGRALTLQYLRP